MGVTRAKKETMTQSTVPERIESKKLLYRHEKSDKQRNNTWVDSSKSKGENKKPTKTHDPEPPKAPGWRPMRRQSIAPKPMSPSTHLATWRAGGTTWPERGS